MNHRAVFSEKITRIMPLMGSPMDGEALNACRAVERVLAHDGLTYRDLAQAIPTKGAAEAVYNVHDLAPTPAYRPFRRKIFTFTPAQTARHREMARYCRERDGGRLTPSERAFIGAITSRRRELSVRQADWLTDITDRLEQEDRRAWA